MAAKESVGVRPSEKRLAAHVASVGLERMTNVLANERKMATSRTADSSRPAALITGVCRCRQKTQATASVSKMPATTTVDSFLYIFHVGRSSRVIAQQNGRIKHF